MSLTAREYLRHILNETTYLIENSANLNKNALLQDETLKRAYVRSIEVIGEAVKQLPNELRQKYDTVEWRSLAGMRDRLIHNYFGIDYDIVWDVVANKIPDLDAEVKRIFELEYS